MIRTGSGTIVGVENIAPPSHYFNNINQQQFQTPLSTKSIQQQQQQQQQNSSTHPTLNRASSASSILSVTPRGNTSTTPSASHSNQNEQRSDPNYFSTPVLPTQTGNQQISNTLRSRVAFIPPYSNLFIISGTPNNNSNGVLYNGAPISTLNERLNQLKSSNSSAQKLANPQLSSFLVQLAEDDWELGGKDEYASFPDEWQTIQRERSEHINQVKKIPSHPTPWLALLAYDLNKWKSHQTSFSSTQALLRLYDRATRAIDKDSYRKHEDFFKIWMGYAKFQV